MLPQEHGAVDHADESHVPLDRGWHEELRRSQLVSRLSKPRLRLTFGKPRKPDARYVDKGTGLTRNLHWDDIVADRLAVSSNPSQTKPLQLVCLSIGDALRLSASERFRSKKG